MKAIKQLINNLWNSPTFTTWGSFLSKSLFAVLLLPVIATTLPQAEITVWLLFLIYVGLQNIGDMGFGVTFVRVISYAMGGATDISNFKSIQDVKRKKEVNWDLIDKTYSTTKRVLFLASLGFLIVLFFVGYFSLKEPISYTENQRSMWLAAIVVLVATFIRFNGNRYSIFLQGTNKVALLRRWEAIISVLSILSSFIVVITTKSLLYLVISQQAFAVIMVVVYRFLCLSVFENRFKNFTSRGIDKVLFKSIFSIAMKSWVGVLMSYGVVQASGIIVAQMGNSPEVAAYLFSLRILDLIKNFSNAPFYSKIPLYNRLFIEGNIGGLLARVKNGMRFTLFTFVLATIAIGVAGNFALDLIGSNVRMVEPYVWLAMVTAYFFERYGALHVQFYSITNNIIWHIASGVSGLIYILFSLLFIFVFDLGIISFPLALIFSNVLFYMGYAAMNTYRFFKLKFVEFESKTSLYPLILFIVYVVYVIIAQKK